MLRTNTRTATVLGCLALLALLAGGACKGGAGDGAATTTPQPAATTSPAAEEPEAAAATAPAKAVPSAETPAEAPPLPSAASRALGERFPAGKNCTIEALQAAVRPHNDEVRACFQEALLRKPDLGGKLRFELVVDELGRARSVAVKENGLGDDRVAECARGVLTTVSYAPAPADRPCIVVYPFDFQVSPEVRAKLRGGE